MEQPVHVVVTCSNRKRLTPPPTCLLRAHRRPDGTASIESWLAALRDADCDAVPATQLYGGEHWQAVLQLDSRPRVVTWVCSAGYGLVPVEAPLCAYGATFSAGHVDSVAGTVASPEQS